MRYGTLSAWESNGKKLTHDLVEYEIIKTRDTINAIIKRPVKTSGEIIYERALSKNEKYKVYFSKKFPHNYFIFMPLDAITNPFEAESDEEALLRFELDE